ncbi:MAG: ATP-binding cassette domain-containing protein [Micromonosporaceae bacterium]|nr:ATP-binding cassette domain-containing protein [Micromonosporaceae bacterium]
MSTGSRTTAPHRDGSAGPAPVRQGQPDGEPALDPDYVRIESLFKQFSRTGQATRVLNDVSLTIGEGELLTLLGPSGCGKTTTLRCVAGLERPDSGAIWVRGAPVVDADAGSFVPPEARRIGMAFQSYALWPHMSVLDNVGYPLRMRRVRREGIRRRADEILDRVGLGGKLRRFPRELSGGEQQRVALARAVVANPDVLLLDEPLSNLDARLRQQTLIWLVALLRDLKITTIYVTHDQSEALAISDQIAVMHGGVILQRGTPSEVYDHPLTRFVAEFIGAANLLPGQVTAHRDGGCEVLPAAGGQPYLALPPADAHPASGDEVALVVRPEKVVVQPGHDRPGCIDAVVNVRVYSGSGWQYVMLIGDQELRVDTAVDQVFERGNPVSLSFDGAPLPLVSHREPHE